MGGIPFQSDEDRSHKGPPEGNIPGRLQSAARVSVTGLEQTKIMYPHVNRKYEPVCVVCVEVRMV